MVGQVDLEELDQRGYTVARQLLPRSLTAALRQCTDELLAARQAAAGDGAASAGPVSDFRNLALYGGEQVAVLADALAEHRSLSVAAQLSRCGDDSAKQQLQLIEQVLIKTDPSSAEQHGPTSWHLDWIFLREHYDATPRQTYFHMVTYLCDVAAGQASFTIVPGSHHKTFAAAARLCSLDELQHYSGKLGQGGGPFAALKDDPIELAGIDISAAVEVTGSEGDCVICEHVPVLRYGDAVRRRCLAMPFN